MKLSARNQFAGTVTNVNRGAVNGIVTIDVNGEPVSATISLAAIDELGLEPVPRQGAAGGPWRGEFHRADGGPGREHPVRHHRQRGGGRTGPGSRRGRSGGDQIPVRHGGRGLNFQGKQKNGMAFRPCRFFRLSKKPRRVRHRNGESDAIYFLRRRVRRRKYFSARKRARRPL